MSDLNFEIFTEQGVVPVPTFRKAIENSIYLLNQFDAGIAHRGRGVLDWFVDRVSSNGDGNGGGPHHFAFHFVSQLRTSRALPEIPPNFAPRVTKEFLEGVKDIEVECETPPYLSEVALSKAAEFGAMIRQRKATGFRFTADQQMVDITDQVEANVQKLIGKKTVSYGTIAGRLEELSIHGGPKARLYHELTQKVVTCVFTDDYKFRTAADAFGRIIFATGEIHNNVKGDPIRLLDPEIEIIDDRPRFEWDNLPENIVLPQFADTYSTAEYMRRIRGD